MSCLLSAQVNWKCFLAIPDSYTGLTQTPRWTTVMEEITYLIFFFFNLWVSWMTLQNTLRDVSPVLYPMATPRLWIFILFFLLKHLNRVPLHTWSFSSSFLCAHKWLASVIFLGHKGILMAIGYESHCQSTTLLQVHFTFQKSLAPSLSYTDAYPPKSMDSATNNISLLTLDRLDFSAPYA